MAVMLNLLKFLTEYILKSLKMYCCACVFVQGSLRRTTAALLLSYKKQKLSFWRRAFICNCGILLLLSLNSVSMSIIES